MRVTLPLLSLLVLPLTAFALTIQPATLFLDVRSSSPEAAGIHLLAADGIVNGYSDGRFGPTRQINRAEFLKIAMKSASTISSEFAPETCFPDVKSDDWFSLFVCTAKAKGVVRGRPDGLFHPEQPVQYDEALKILTLVFNYTIPALTSGDWAEPYYRAAATKSVDLPITIRFDTPLTRGLAARLAAAFLAESAGQLPALRLAEAGQYSRSSETSSSSSSSSEASLAPTAPTVLAQPPPPSSASLFTLPSVSHFLVLGQRSDAIANLSITSRGETARLVSAQVKLFSEVTALDTLELVNALDGTVVMTLPRRTTTDLSDYKMTYEAQIDLADQLRIPADKPLQLVLRAKIRSIDNNGASEQFLQVRTFSVTTYGETTQNTINHPAVAPFPAHQTSFGRIVGVQRVSPERSTILSGTGSSVSTFSFSGSVLAGKSLTIEHVAFQMLKTGGVTVSNWRIRPQGSQMSIPCTVSQTDGSVLTCTNLGSIGTLGASSLVLEVLADIAVFPSTTSASLEIDLASGGSPSSFGSVQWTDQSGHFRWIEGPSPPTKGTKWQP